MFKRRKKAEREAPKTEILQFQKGDIFCSCSGSYYYGSSKRFYMVVRSTPHTVWIVPMDREEITVNTKDGPVCTKVPTTTTYTESDIRAGRGVTKKKLSFDNPYFPIIRIGWNRLRQWFPERDDPRKPGYTPNYMSKYIPYY